jgi:uncharacterized membrane-anchored protein YhcB (DUF1043 family)
VVHVVWLLAQAAVPAAPTGSPSPEAWVAIVLALIATVGNVVLAVVRRGGDTKVASAERAAKAAQDKAKELEARLDKHEAKVAQHELSIAEHDATIDTVSTRVSAPPTEPPTLISMRDRVARLEQDLSAERAAREARVSAQHTQDIEIATQFARLSENVKTLTQQVERFHGPGNVRGTVG